jgi:hypothetical protein
MAQLMGWGSVLSGLVLSLVLGAMPADVKVFGDGELEKVDLSELRDGETRTFGTGEDVITATREGDTIRLTLPKGDRTIDCTVGKGNCYAFTTRGDGDGPSVLMLQKLDDEGEGERKVEVIKIVTGDGAGHAQTMLDWVEDDDIHPDAFGEIKVVTRTGGPHGLLTVLGEDGRQLRCPEGDSTLSLDDEDDGIYYCPKHNVEMEEVKAHTLGHRVIVIRDKEEDAD